MAEPANSAILIIAAMPMMWSRNWASN